MKSSQGRGSLTSRYLTTLLAPAVIAGVMQVTWPLSQHNLVSPYLLAVIFCAWYGGLGPGLLSIVVSLLLTYFFFIEPYFFFWSPKQVDLTSLLFTVVGSLISVMGELMHRERRRAGINLATARGDEGSLDERKNCATLIAKLSPVDHSEPKRGARPQRDSQRRYETLVHSIDGIVWEADPKTFTFNFVSEQAERILGYPLERWFEGPGFWPDHMHPDDRDWAVAFCVDSTARKVDHRFEYRMIAADGHVVWLSDIVTVHVVDDQPVLLRGVMVDITERKQAEDALLETERKYRSIFENAVEGIFQTTPDGRFIAANPALARMLGFDSPEELISTRTNIAQEHYVDPQRREEFKRSLEENGFVVDFEHEAYRKDGSRIWFSENVRAVRDSNGTVVYYEGTTQNITARKLAEEAVRESEERYRDLVENSFDLICTHDLDGLILSANRVARELMGYSSGSYAGGTNFREILAPEVRDQFDDYLKRIRADGAASGLMLVQTRTGEKRIWEYHNTLRTRGISAPIVRGMGRDITEQRRANQSLRLFRALIDQSSDAIEVIDPNTLRFLDCNTSAYHDLGYSREEFLSLSVYDIDPLLDEKMTARLRKEMDRSGFVIFESIHRRKDGSTFPVEVNVKVVRLDRDYRLAVVRDITERKLGEEALRQAEQKYRRIFENASEGIFQSTPDGRYIAANPTLARMYGFASPEELIQSRQDISRQLYVDPTRREEFKRQLEDRDAVRGFEHQVFRKDGSKIWISVNARAVRDEQGAISYYEGTAQDITDRKQAEEALRESEERYRELFENAKDAIYVQDLAGVYTSVNRAAEKLSGYSREEIVGRRFTEFVPPEQIEIVSEFLCRKLVEEGETTYETEVIARDGSRIPVEVNSHLIYENGIGIGVQGTARDITQRKHAEERLREYEKVVEGLEEMILVVDRDFRYLLANHAYLKYRGKNREQVVGHLVADVVGMALFEGLIKEKLEQTFRGQVVHYELRATFSELGERDMLVSLFPIEGPTGIDRAACVLQDITERKQAEEALRQSEERFSKAFQSSPAALSITVVDDGRLLEVNEAFLRMTGFSREEVIGHTTVELDLWTSEYRRAISEALGERGTVENLEIKFQKKSGETRDGLLSAELIHLGAGTCVLGIAQDVTERNRTEETLRSYSRKLIEAQEAERQHIARELHDQIGQVLTAVRINLQTIWNSCETAESRSLIDQGVGTIDAALEQVRDLSFELRPSLLDDLGLVAALRWYSDQYTQRTGIRTKSVTNLPGGQTRLKQELETACFRIVQEALTNVVRHANAKNVSIDLRRVDHKIVLSVKDDGIGFVESANGGAAAIRLGLRGMKERALALGGTLEIESGPVHGTEIRAYFPTGSKED